MRWIILLSLLFGCSGYRFTQQENPLSQYGIQSLSIPMFYNYSNMPEVSAEFTRETYGLLTGFTGLKLKSGYSEKTDAVLIGIIRSPLKTNETIRPSSPRSAKSKIPQVGNRRDFIIPGTSDVELVLQIIMIKKPTEEEIALVRSGIGDLVQTNSKIIFNEKFPIRTRYTRELLEDQGIQVIGTQNAGVQRRTVRSMAESAATSVRDMILYAF